MKGRMMKGHLMLCFCLLSGMAASISTHAASEDEKIQEPPSRELEDGELSIKDEFERFKEGGFFMPPHPRHQHFFGYDHPRDLFRDFKEKIEKGDAEVALCSDQNGEEVEGAVKLSFTCDDGEVTYSCYADILDGGYSIGIPDEVLGKSCTIAVEKIDSTDDETDVETGGVETTEEVDLTEETTVSLDV